MTTATQAPSRAPRLVARVLGFSFGVIALVLAAVFLVLSFQARARLTAAVTENLELSQQRFEQRGSLFSIFFQFFKFARERSFRPG